MEEINNSSCESDDSAIIVEERPLRDIISATAKISPVKKDLLFDKEEMRLMKAGGCLSHGSNTVLVNSVVSGGNKSQTLSNIKNSDYKMATNQHTNSYKMIPIGHSSSLVLSKGESE